MRFLYSPALVLLWRADSIDRAVSLRCASEGCEAPVRLNQTSGNGAAGVPLTAALRWMSERADASGAEREVLWVLNGHCNSPIAGHATLAGSELTLRAAVLDEAGAGFIEVTRRGPAERPRELGRAVGMELLEKGAAEIIARTRVDE